MKFLFTLFILLTLAHLNVQAQKQLVLLKKEKVLLRLHPGDEIKFRVKGSRQIRTTYVNNLLENAVVTHRDTVPFNRIERIYFKRVTRMNVIGGTLAFGGAALFLIDQLNNSVIRGNEWSLDGGVSTASIAAIGVGVPMMLIRKKSQKLSYRYQLMTVRKGSAFWQPDRRAYISPFEP